MKTPTREELRAQVREMMRTNPGYRQCINCLNYDPETSICLPRGIKVFPRVPGCNLHELTEEKIITEAMQSLYSCPADTKEDKIEHLLSLGLTTVNAGTLFLEDAEARIRKIYKACKDKDERRGLRKDLDLFESLTPASRKMAESIRAIEESWQAHMEAFMQEAEKHLSDVEVQYRQYFQSHLDKIFKRDGKYDGESDALFLTSAGTFCMAILDKLKALMEEENEVFPFSEHDMKRYKIKK